MALGAGRIAYLGWVRAAAREPGSLSGSNSKRTLSRRTLSATGVWLECVVTIGT